MCLNITWLFKCVEARTRFLRVKVSFSNLTRSVPFFDELRVV